ncbi:Hsp70 family protein [Asaccharospora irregularis]|uniref:Chaperone protein DnaK n=1 Tax=Asaccharospora irregularis DSM 2635 TaxID=1121321 RepID=A0A1M5LUQ4_9FIRM|nr:Hsp70 family protein [Asaccharospora irregularis]SHG68788.1 molecular chaperone DnaK [Asaccharospora irregularis DSM 2635]
MSSIIGIDLGTTTSEIAYIKNGKPEMISSKISKIIPSLVAIKDRKVYTGHTAENILKATPENVALEFKREIGKSGVKIKVGDEDFLPHELSAILLKELKGIAERYLEREVKEAVITVPANFNSYQRQLTKKAGEMAGFKVERIINEPTAAAMAYGIDNLEEESKILVYDLGGGTFDVTVLEMFSGVLEVRSSRGNNTLGGKDFDRVIERFILEEINKKNKIDLYNEITDREQLLLAKTTIKECAVKAKKELSTKNSAEIFIPFISFVNDDLVNFQSELTRDKFNELTKHLIDSTAKTIEEALKAANYTKEDIDKVILVGGATRIFGVNELVESLFPGKINKGINPDEAVAMGAAVQAGIKNEEINTDTSLIVTDRCSYNIGINVQSIKGGKKIENVFDCLIPVDSSIPCSKVETYYTSYDWQTIVNIQVYEGYAPFVYDNTEIASFKVDGIPAKLKGEEKIEVEFEYNLNGVLEVYVSIPSVGKVHKEIIHNLKVEQSSGNVEKYLIDSQIVVNKEELEKWKEYELADLAKKTIELAERKMKKLDKDKCSEITVVLDNLKQAIISGNKDLVDKLEEKLTDILFNYRGI